MLCPVLACRPDGQFLLMLAAEPMSEQEARRRRRENMFPDSDYIAGGEDEPFEYRAADWGKLGGRPVAIDYAKPALTEEGHSMIADSFKSRFAAPILTSTKTQTIRADRKRHARPGEMVQLFTGMRMRQCRRLGETQCVAVERVLIVLPHRRQPPRIVVNALEGEFVRGATWGMSLNAFDLQDGFRSFDAMVASWRKNHPGQDEFGVLIRWQPPIPADAPDIAGAA